MDSKTIFVRTIKGEEEARSKTANLSGDIKRSLLMIDGKSTFKQISKRAAPSLRDSLEDMLNELVHSGFIHDKRKSDNTPKMAVPSKIVVPAKKVSPEKIIDSPKQPAAIKKASAFEWPDDEVHNVLDFATGFQADAQEKPPNKTTKKEDKALTNDKEKTDSREIETKIKQNILDKARQEAESRTNQKLAKKNKQESEEKARREAEEKAKKEAEENAIQKALEKARREAEEKVRQEAEEKARRLAEQKAMREAIMKVRREAEEKARREAEEKARREAEEKARREAEEKARREAEEKARREAEEKARREAEEKARREAEEKSRREAEEKAIQEAEETARALIDAQTRESAELNVSTENNLDEAKLNIASVKSARTTSATVMFLDVVAYTKLPVKKQIEVKKQFNNLVSDCLNKLGDGERIILDTGDGAAIGFLQHPEEALKAAMQFQRVVTANGHNDYPELNVRIGIHLGPISIVQDMNGLSNMVGDGINDAQRVMGFAGTDQVFVSRSFYDFVSRLSNEYDRLFHYQGALEDKHGREHPVYKLVDVQPVIENEFSEINLDDTGVTLDPFSFEIPDLPEQSGTSELHSDLGLQKEDIHLMESVGNAVHPEKIRQSAAEKKSNQDQAGESGSKSESSSTAKAKEINVPDPKTSVDEVGELEAVQAKVWAEAEKRAKEASSAMAASNVSQPLKPQPVAKTVAKVASVKRKPFPVVKLGIGILALLLIVLYIAPFVIPAKEYVRVVEQSLSERLNQPVHIEHLEGRFLPLPRLDLIGMSIGDENKVKIALARLNFSVFGIVTGVNSIGSLELAGMQIEDAALQQTTEWLQLVAASNDNPVDHIFLHEGRLVGDGFSLSEISGEIDFDDEGKFGKASLHTKGNKYRLLLEAAPLYRIHVSIVVHNSALPLLPNWVFDDMTADGTLTKNELMLDELNGTILGGTLRGDARLSWNSGWRAQGTLVTTSMPVQNIISTFQGDMEGAGSFKMQAANLNKLTDAAALNGSFVISKGVINGIDLIETARLNSTENLPGGRTFFEELWGDVSYVKDVYDFRNLKISAGVLTARGKLNYSGQKIKGLITADLTLREGIPPVPLELSGTQDNLILRAIP